MNPADYTRDSGVTRPHDLVWLSARAFAVEAPAWVHRAMAAGEPCVIRRAPRRDHRLPVGVRGHGRSQRHPDWVERARVVRRATPEMLARGAVDSMQSLPGGLPAIQMLPAVARVLDDAGLCWGVTGAVGFQMACSRVVCHEASDLDLLIRAPRRMPRSTAAALVQRLAEFPARCDVQLETPAGGVALAEWASGAARVLVKSDARPYLTADPWAVEVAEQPRPRIAGTVS